MSQVRVVTDSSAGIPEPLAEDLGISVVPLRVRLGRKIYQEGVDLSSEEFLERLSRTSQAPALIPPSEDDFVRAYSRLCEVSSEIISIHLSSRLSAAFHSAQAARDSLLGRCQLAVMDSQLISLGLRELVLGAAQAAQAGASLEEIVKLVRGMIPHIYIVVVGANLDYLERGGRIGGAEAFLSGMLSIKPILIMEEGEFVAMEKARGRARALERLYEFVTEFPRIERLSLLHSASNHEVDELVERISLTLPDLRVDRSLYGPSLASLIGPSALALVVYEGM